MRPDEWNVLSAVIEEAWRGEFDEQRAAVYYGFLADYETSEVEQALHVLVRNGSPFVPAVAEIVSAIEAAQRVEIPTWPEAWALTRRVISRHGAADPVAAIARLEADHPIVASFASTYGWVRICREEVDHEQYGAATLRRLGLAYDEHVERQRDRERQGLALAATTRRSLAGPRRVDAAALLPRADAA